jgi:hypothetical protein
MLNAPKSTQYSFGMTQQRQDHGKAMQQLFVDSLKPVIENVIKLLGIAHER